MTRPASPLSIAICAFNAVEYTKLLIASIRKNSAYDHEIVIYSDGSSDGTLAWLRKETGIVWRHDRKNLGICTAMNRVAEQASREYLFFPNTDHVLAPGWDEALLKRLAPRKVVSTQCIEPGVVPVASIFHARNCGTRFDEFNEELFSQAASDLAQDRETPGVNYPFVISKALWKELGGLDQRFDPGPANDPDLFYRLSLMGIKMVRAEDVLTYHFSGKSSRLAEETNRETEEWHRITDRNEARFEEKWGERYRYANGGLPDPGPAARKRWDQERRANRASVVRTALRIAIDARRVGPRGGGIREYTVNLARALSRHEDRPEIHCLSIDPEHFREEVGSSENLFVHLAPPPSSGSSGDTGNAILEELKCTVYHGPSFEIPDGIAIPGVVTVHDLIFLKYPEAYPPEFCRHLKGVMERSLARAVRVIVVSDQTGKDLTERYPEVANRLDRIYEALPESASGPVSPELVEEVRRRWTQGTEFILSVGVQQKRKNAAGLVRAFAALPPNLRENLKLVLVGGTECEDPALEREIARLDLFNAVVRTPQLTREELTALYRGCRLFAYPSLYEGFGLPTLEAMAQERPVVCSDGGALAEIVGSAAQIYPAGNEEALTQAIQAVLTDVPLENSLIEKGKERISAFSWDLAARQTLESYQTAIHQGPIVIASKPQLDRTPNHLSPARTNKTSAQRASRPRIAIDARLLGHTSLGTGRYTAEIIRALLSSSESYEIAVIGPKSLDLDRFPNAERIVQHVHAETSTLLDPAWEQFSLPSHLLGCDIYFAPTGIVPVARPCKTVPVIHDLGFEDEPQYYEPRLRSYLAKWIRQSCIRADRVIAVSSFTKNRISSLYDLDPQKVRVVHHGRPEGRSMKSPDIGASRQRGIKAEEEFVLSVSSFEPNKNLGMLVDAFAQICSSWPGKLILAGRSGRDLPVLETKVRAAGYPGRIRMIVNPSDHEIDRLYSEARLFVYPSLYEGFGMPLLEALTAGLPIIAKRGTACPEVIGDAGILLEDVLQTGLSTAMMTLLKDPDASLKCSQRALGRAAEFSWSKSGKETWQVLKECLEER